MFEWASASGYPIAERSERIARPLAHAIAPAHRRTLRDWLAEFVTPERRLAEPDSPLFRNSDGREGEGWWSKSALTYTWRQACAKVGVSDVKMYEGLKHSTATALKAAGVDDRVLAQLAGHRDPRSIERYAKLQPTTIVSALKRLRENK